MSPDNTSWYNAISTAQVAWTGGIAQFSGAPGTVTVSAFGSGDVQVNGVVATGLTFNVADYVVTSPAEYSTTILTNAASFVLTANADATVAVGSLTGNGSTVLTKTGAGRVTLSSTLNLMSGVAINAGELRLAGTAWTDTGTTYTLANAVGAVLALDQTSTVTVIGALAGGGATGGVVRPGGTVTLAQTLKIAGAADATFAGVLEDNGSVGLFLTKSGAGVQTLTGANTYTGATVVSEGSLVLAENGALLGSSVSVSAGATLKLDNTGTNVASRLGDSKAVSLSGGTFSFIGNGSAASAETLGALTLGAGNSKLHIDAGDGQTAVVTFAAIAGRSAGPLLEVSGDGFAQLTSGSNVNGILGAYAYTGNNWVTLDGTKRLVAFGAYTTSLSSGASADNVRFTTGATFNLATVTRNSLAFETSAGAVALDLGAGSNVFTLTSGGIISGGAGSASLLGGTLVSRSSAAQAKEFIVVAQNALTIGATLANGTTGTTTTSLTKGGTGTLTLTGANTFTGDLTVNSGAVVLVGGAALNDVVAVKLVAGATLDVNGTTETIGGLSNAGMVLVRGGQLTVAGSGLDGSAAIDLGGGTLRVTSGATTGFGGVISGSGNLTMAGAGSVTLSGANTFAGTVRVEAGSLLLLDEATDVIADSTAVVLTNGLLGISASTLAIANETFGSLAVAGAATLQFHSSTSLPSLLVFGASAAESWSGTLLVTNYTDGLDTLRFGSDGSALTGAQLGLITFDIGGVMMPAQINALGIVSPIPEPGTWAAAAGALALLVAGVRRRSGMN